MVEDTVVDMEGSRGGGSRGGSRSGGGSKSGGSRAEEVLNLVVQNLTGVLQNWRGSNSGKSNGSGSVLTLLLNPNSPSKAD